MLMIKNDRCVIAIFIDLNDLYIRNVNKLYQFIHSYQLEGEKKMVDCAFGCKRYLRLNERMADFLDIEVALSILSDLRITILIEYGFFSFNYA